MRRGLLLGFLATFWATPRMTLGADYADYRRQVPRFFPVPWRRAGRPRGCP